VAFSELALGDYFSDDEKNKYRKIPNYELHYINTPMTLNAFAIQANAHVFINQDQLVTFIKHEPWLNHENPGFPNISIELSELEHQLDLLEKYLNVTEVFLTAQINNNLDILKEIPHDFDTRGDVQDFQEFINFFENSFFISLYSFLETSLYKQCRSRTNIAIAIDDFKDKKGFNISNKIEKVQKYLETIGTTFPFQNDHCWKEIRSYQKLRNCLTHNNGIIPKNSKFQNLRKYIASKNNLSLTEMFGNDLVNLSNDFCLEALEIIGYLLKSMLFHNQADDII
jgi:hypothetical protein